MNGRWVPRLYIRDGYAISITFEGLNSGVCVLTSGEHRHGS